MSSQPSQPLVVDGFTIKHRVELGMLWVAVSKDGIDALFGISSSPEAMPPLEILEYYAMNVWRASNNLDRIAKGLPRADEET